MAEEVVGLVRLHGLSPVDAEVKHCRGDQEGEREREKGSSNRLLDVEAEASISADKPVLLPSTQGKTSDDRAS